MVLQISPKTILFALIIFYVFNFLISIYSTLLLFFISYIIYCTLDPAVEYLQKYNIKRKFAIPIVILALVILMFAVFALFSSQAIFQFTILAQKMPLILSSFFSYIERTFPFISTSIDVAQIETQITSAVDIKSIVSNIGNMVFAVVSFSINTLMVLMISSFMLYEKGSSSRESRMLGILFKDSKFQISLLLNKIQKKLGSWVAGQSFLCLQTAFVNYLLFLFLGNEFAVAFAIFAGLMEIVPSIGPLLVTVVGTILIIGLGGPISYVLIYIVLVTIYQQLQNFLIAPKVMQSVVGLSPIVTLCSLVLVANIPNVSTVLIFITIPIIVILQIVAEEFLHTRYNMEIDYGETPKH